MASDHKGELHFPLATHRAAAQLMVEVWDQMKSELSHRSHRKSKPGEQQPACVTRDVQTVFSELCGEHSISPTCCESSCWRCPVWITVQRALYHLLPTGHVRDWCSSTRHDSSPAVSIRSLGQPSSSNSTNWWTQKGKWKGTRYTFSRPFRKHELFLWPHTWASTRRVIL